MEPSSQTAQAHTTTGKLVRDRIPEIIRAQGGRPVSATLDGAAYARALRHKLVEEAGEVARAGDDIIRHADGKRAARGGFERRLWLSASQSTHSGDHMDRASEPTPS
jgi:hypothetical protein